MKNEYHYAKYAKQILQMSVKDAAKTLNCILRCDGAHEVELIVSQFSKVLGGAV